MKVIIAGSRTIDNRRVVHDVIENSPWRLDSSTSPFAQTDKIYEVVHGGARGVDTIAGELAEERDTPVTVFEADWDEYPKAAGPIRNKEMAEYADALIAVWDGSSAGTKDMIRKAMEHGLAMYVEVIDGV